MMDEALKRRLDECLAPLLEPKAVCKLCGSVQSVEGFREHIKWSHPGTWKRIMTAQKGAAKRIK